MSIGGFRIGFAGSAKRETHQRELSQVIGREIMEQGHRLITGGCSGGYTQFCVESAVDYLAENNRSKEIDKRILHIIPDTEKFATVASGQFLECKKKDRTQRRPIMASLMDVIITVEGGDGTMSEGEACFFVGTPIVPIGRSGGSSFEIYKKIKERSLSSQYGTPSPSEKTEFYSLYDIFKDKDWEDLLNKVDTTELGKIAVELAVKLARKRMDSYTGTASISPAEKVDLPL